jgi:hypothetical protein
LDATKADKLVERWDFPTADMSVVLRVASKESLMAPTKADSKVAKKDKKKAAPKAAN